VYAVPWVRIPHPPLLPNHAGRVVTERDEGATLTAASSAPVPVTRHRARFSPRLIALAWAVCFPAVWFAGPGGRPDLPLLVAMTLVLVAAWRGATISTRSDAARREWIALAFNVATSLTVIAVVVRTELSRVSWLGVFAALAVGLATIRGTRVRLATQIALMTALGVLLVRGHPTPLAPAGSVEILGPLLLVVVIAGLSSALADDLALARRRELATRRAAERRAELLEAVRELSAAGPGQAVDVTVEALRGLGFPVAAVLLLEGDRLVPRRVAGMAMREDHQDGISGVALRTGRTVISPDYRNDDLRLPGVELGAALATPITAEGRPLGVLSAGLDEPGAPPMGDVEVVEVLAAHLGGALATERVVRNQDALLARLRDLDGLRASFVDRVSEDLRDPLTVVRGVAQTLAAYGDRLPDEQRRVLLDRLTVQAADLGETLEALLDFSRVHVGRSDPRPERIDVIQLLAPALSGTGVELRVAGRPVVMVDRDLVRRAVELLQRASLDVDDGLQLRRAGDVLSIDVHLRQLDALKGGFARALAEQLLVAGGARSERLPDGLRLLLPLADQQVPA
jgi:K+-sensing histidine kinase KdpD